MWYKYGISTIKGSTTRYEGVPISAKQFNDPSFKFITAADQKVFLFYNEYLHPLLRTSRKPHIGSLCLNDAVERSNSLSFVKVKVMKFNNKNLFRLVVVFVVERWRIMYHADRLIADFHKLSNDYMIFITIIAQLICKHLDYEFDVLMSVVPGVLNGSQGYFTLFSSKHKYFIKQTAICFYSIEAINRHFSTSNSFYDNVTFETKKWPPTTLNSNTAHPKGTDPTNTGTILFFRDIDEFSILLGYFLLLAGH